MNIKEVLPQNQQVTSQPKKTTHAVCLAKPEAAEALREFVKDWESLSEVGRNSQTLTQQHDLAMAVLPKLGASDDLLRFLNFLTERGAGDLRKELIENNLGEIFTGQDAQAYREWLLTLEDAQLRESLSRIAGMTFSGIGFKEYFDKMGECGGQNSQAALLSGYCCAMAKTDPESAVKAYKDLGYPKKIDNTGLAAVYAAMPPSTDFLKFASGIKEDKMTLARRSRTALLRNWAGVKPQEAAQYVLSNCNSVVAPEQMAEVVSVWATNAPDMAASWISKASECNAKDEGITPLAKHWMSKNPATAWEFASKVGDFNKRVAIATLVFKEWAKTDQNAATKAWDALFPAKN